MISLRSRLMLCFATAACGDASKATVDAAVTADAVLVPADAATDVCGSFCGHQPTCSFFGMPAVACIAECERTRSFFAIAAISEPCRTAVDAVFTCMGQQTCAAWTDATINGTCAPAMMAQLAACNGGAGYFPGWDAIVQSCNHAVAECHVDVPQISTWIDVESCWGESKLTALNAYDLHCSAEELAYQACIRDLPCTPLQAFLRGNANAAPTCAVAGMRLSSCMQTKP